MAKEPSRAAKVREILRRVGPEGIHVADLAQELGDDRKNTEYSVVDLTKRGEAVRTGPGRYRLCTEEERTRTANRRSSAFVRAEREESGEVVPLRRTTGIVAGAVEVPRLIAIGRRRDGSIVCEDGTGDLWVATRVAEGKKR